MKLGVLREMLISEARVAMTPESTLQLQKLEQACFVEAGAGERAGFSDTADAAAGVSIVPDAAALYAATDVITKVRPPTEAEAAMLRKGQTLISFFWPAQNASLLGLARAQGATVHCHGHGAAHLPRPEDGRALVHGQHRTRLERSRLGWVPGTS